MYVCIDWHIPEYCLQKRGEKNQQKQNLIYIKKKTGKTGKPKSKIDANWLIEQVKGRCGRCQHRGFALWYISVVGRPHDEQHQSMSEVIKINTHTQSDYPRLQEIYTTQHHHIHLCWCVNPRHDSIIGIDLWRKTGKLGKMQELRDFHTCLSLSLSLFCLVNHQTTIITISLQMKDDELRERWTMM